MQYGSVMAKRFKRESMKTLGFCNRNDQHSDALKDKNNVMDGARDTDQMLSVICAVPVTSCEC